MIPVAICTQNWRSTSRRSEDALGERIALLPVNCFIHPAGRPINTSWLKVLHRPVESTQYSSHEYRRLAADFGVTMSVNRKGNAWDNAAMESFFKTLKVERIYQVRYDTRAQARLDIVDWIEGYYNRVRMHTVIGFLTPVAKERSLLAA